MQLETSLFGTIEVDQDKTINFAGGIPGFEHLKEFFLLVIEQTKPILWLQSADEDVALPVISPFDVDPKYAPEIDDETFDTLELKGQEDLLVLTVAVIPDELKDMTANFAAPILINIAAGKGRQVIVEGDEYQVRQPIFDLLLPDEKEHNDHVSTDQA